MQAPEREFLLATTLFIIYVIYSLAEYRQCNKSYREWWNNQRMQRISVGTAFFLGFLSVVCKLLCVSDTVFEVTRKDHLQQPTDANLGRFTFDKSPIFISGTALVVVHMMAMWVALLRQAGLAIVAEAEGPGVGEMVCTGWILISFWPFVRGLIGKGSYGIPWSVVIKAGALAILFLQLCINL